MPKPVFGINGSGMHTNQSLFNADGTNAFFDPNGPLQLSEIAYNIFEMTAQEKEAAGIASLPANLKEAVEALKANPIAKEVLGKHLLEHYIENKEKEWDDYRTAVTDWELKKYLSNY